MTERSHRGEISDFPPPTIIQYTLAFPIKATNCKAKITEKASNKAVQDSIHQLSNY
jgi:hypothetical protein